MGTRKEYQQYPRTIEQLINDEYNLKQQMEYQGSLRIHGGDCSIYKKDDDNDSNDDGCNNTIQDVEYYEEDKEEDDDDEYYEFDSENNKRRISRNEAMAYSYRVICECYKANGWEQYINRWIENSDGILVTEGWDPTFKERFYSIHSELKAEMKQMINNNCCVINQEEKIQASELERKRKRK